LCGFGGRADGQGRLGAAAVVVVVVVRAFGDLLSRVKEEDDRTGLAFVVRCWRAGGGLCVNERGRLSSISGRSKVRA
jgi:hypothetical protein